MEFISRKLSSALAVSVCDLLEKHGLRVTTITLDAESFERLAYEMAPAWRPGSMASLTLHTIAGDTEVVPLAASAALQHERK